MSSGSSICQLRGFDVHQAQFAHEICVSLGQLSRYEQGRSEIGAEILLRLARKSGRTIEWLLTSKNRDQPEIAAPSSHAATLFPAGTPQDGDWGGNPASDQSGVCEEC